MKKLIGVIGGRDCSAEIYNLAFEVGQLIAQNGYGLVCGGMGGVMEAAAKGCRQEGGLTVGILPTDSSSSANPYIEIAIPTGIGIARNLMVVLAAEGLIAIDGKYGTLSEIAYALQLQKPIIGLKSWMVDPQILVAQSANEAMEKLLAQLP